MTELDDYLKFKLKRNQISTISPFTVCVNSFDPLEDQEASLPTRNWITNLDFDRQEEALVQHLNIIVNCKRGHTYG